MDDVSAALQPVRVVEESSLMDALPQMDVSVTEGVTYTIVKAGSSKGRDVLTDSNGYCYSLKPRKTGSKYWRCVVRNKNTYCRATVIQDDDDYIRGQYDHICTPHAGVTVARKVTASVG